MVSLSYLSRLTSPPFGGFIMKIAFLISSIKEVGPVLMVRTLIAQLQQAGHECTTFYFDNVEIDWDTPLERISFFRPYDFGTFDIVHSHGFRPNLYVTLYKSFTPRSTRFVSTVHSYILEEFRFSFGKQKGWFLGHFFLLSLRRHDKIVTLSDDAIAYYAQWLPKHKLHRCYNGVSVEHTERLTPAEQEEIVGFKGDSKLIGTCSSLVKVKGVDVLLRGFRRLPPTYKLWIIGEGDFAYYQKMCDEMGISDRVCLAGFRHAAHRYFPFFDLYVQTSWSEGFCLALTEAALYGKKIVSSDIPSMTEKYARDEVAYFELPSAEALEQAIHQAEDNDEMAEKAHQRAKTTFNAWQMGKSYLTLYQYLLGNL